MFPGLLVRAAIDWVRHNANFHDSNPYSRCEEVVQVCQKLWQEEIGPANASLTPDFVAAYWAEFFHAEDPSPDESEWREGLIKRSGQYDSFPDWQAWFKESYAKVYTENDIWTGVLTTAWAHTHKLEAIANKGVWDFQPATPYLLSSEMWRIERHLDLLIETLQNLWQRELLAYEAIGFSVHEDNLCAIGKIEGLGFDSNQHWLIWPAQAKKEKTKLDLGEMVADIVLPSGENWYRQRDNLVFAKDCIDITALTNKASYKFNSLRRLFELAVDNDYDRAKQQAKAEGWMVPDLEGVGG